MTRDVKKMKARHARLARAIGKRVRDLRGDWSRERFIYGTSISRQALRDYELGNSIPGGIAILDLCTIGQVSASFILRGREDA